MREGDAETQSYDSFISGLFCRISSLFMGSFAKETYQFAETQSYDSFISLATARRHGWGKCKTAHSCGMRLIYICDMTHSYDSFMSGDGMLRLIHMTHSFHEQELDAMGGKNVTRHIHVGCDWFICVTWLIRMCDMTGSYVWHDSFICVTWLIHVWRDWFTFLIHVVPNAKSTMVMRERWGAGVEYHFQEI